MNGYRSLLTQVAFETFCFRDLVEANEGSVSDSLEGVVEHADGAGHVRGTEGCRKMEVEKARKKVQKNARVVVV